MRRIKNKIEIIIGQSLSSAALKFRKLFSDTSQLTDGAVSGLPLIQCN